MDAIASPEHQLSTPSEPEMAIRRLAQEYAWHWFQLCAQQRMTLFNYGLIVLGGTAYGFSVCFVGKWYGVSALVAVSGFLASLAFLSLDRRNSYMTKTAEAHLSSGVENFLAPFVGDTIRIAGTVTSRPPDGMLTFGKIARISYTFYALLAIIGFVASILVQFVPKISAFF